MFYEIFYKLLYNPEGVTSVFRLFRYITFRTAYATFTAFLVTLLLGGWMIKKMQEIGMNQIPKEPKKEKAGTPTMGGIIIIASVCLSVLLWTRWDNEWIWLLLFLILGMGTLGFVDDYLKYKHKNPMGLSGRYKFLVQCILASLFAIYLYINPANPHYPTALNVPFINKPVLHLGPLYILFITLVIVGTSNAVNLTDGLDGLAIGAFIFAALAYCGMSYLAGHYNFAHYLKIIYIPKAGEVTVFLGALIGASLGFLWFNAYPAQIFMGDTGALAIGAVLGAAACLIKQELLLLIVGGLFVFETLSVIIQVLSFKLFRKRVFKMAPVHHHFEIRGWPEPRIIIRFWIIAGILALLTLSTLKIR